MFKSLLVFVLYFCIKNNEASQIFLKPPNFHEIDSFTKMEDWPCPPTNDIAPCNCYVNDDFKISIDCQNVVELDIITRIFSVKFPFNVLERIVFSVNNVGIWEASQPIKIPKNIFQDKTARDIWINFKVEEVDPEAFANSADVLEGLSISGPGWNYGVNPLKTFPLYILKDFPNLKWFTIQNTLISDETFQWNDKFPKFEDLRLSNLGKIV